MSNMIKKKKCWYEFDFPLPDHVARREFSRPEYYGLAGSILNLRPSEGPNVRSLALLLHDSLAFLANSIQLTEPLPLLPTLRCLLWLQS